MTCEELAHALERELDQLNPFPRHLCFVLRARPTRTANDVGAHKKTSLVVESEIRLATEADTKTLKDLIQQFCELEGIPFHPNEIEQNLSILLRDQSLGSAWLLVHEHRIIGYTILIYSFDLELGGLCALVTDLYLESAQRRKGHGRRMLQHLEEFCRKSGFKALELAVERRNAGALAFYKECGFQTHDRILMSKRILPR